MTQPSTATLLLDACDFVLSSGKPATLGGDRISWSGPEVVPLASGCEWSKPLAGWGPVNWSLPSFPLAASSVSHRAAVTTDGQCELG